MSKTTFSGPVASQNGFVAPTFTSTTLPYFEIGNIVYVENLNTLAYGGVDQWYRQDTGAGLGTGGNVGPVGTTYTEGVDYSSGGVSWNGGGGPSITLSLNEYSWTSPTAFAAMLATPAGTAVSFNTNYGPVVAVLAGTFSGGAGSYSVSITASTYPPTPSMSSEPVASITVG